MDTFSSVALMLLGIIAFLRFRDGDLGGWLKAKFLNSAQPIPANLRAPIPSGSVSGGVRGGVIGGTGWVLPADGAVTSGFGPRRSPGGIGSTNHKGVDLDGTRGDPVRAARAGRVIYAGNSGGYGLRVDVDHGALEDGARYVTRYAHLSKIDTRVGAQVSSGELLGRIGSTGTSTGDHLHFEIRRNGIAVDPLPYLPVGVR